MLIRIGYDIVFDLPAPAPMTVMLYTHHSRWNDLREPDVIRVEPHAPLQTYTDAFGNRVGRLVAPGGKVRFVGSSLIEDPGLPDEQGVDAIQHPVESLPPDCMQYLMGSRYCETDRLADLAWELFGHTKPGWERAAAVSAWVHNHITFGYEFARPNKTAVDAYYERQGVCRDFQHLAVTLSRCVNIPARYVTGYLGDIGIPYSPAPMDFSAWYEVYLGYRWWTMDARHNQPRIGRVLMATGRDATDVAITTSFGMTRLEKFEVVTEEVK